MIAKALLPQVEWNFHDLFLQFLNPCVDIIAQAIFRAYDDGADIS